VLVAALLTIPGFTGLGVVAGAQSAEAARCSYSNLTSVSVKNETCRAGAYAYGSAGGVWHQSGNWVPRGRYSYNWHNVCYVRPGMIGRN